VVNRIRGGEAVLILQGEQRIGANHAMVWGPATQGVGGQIRAVCALLHVATIARGVLAYTGDGLPVMNGTER
jgi:hypothetical protein